MANILEKIKDFFKRFTGDEPKMLEEGSITVRNVYNNKGNIRDSLKTQENEQTDFNPTRLCTTIEQDYFDSFKSEQDFTAKKLREIFETNFQSDNPMASYIGRGILNNEIRFIVLEALNKRMSLDRTVVESEKSATEIYEQLRNGDSSNLSSLMQEVLEMYTGNEGVSVADKIKERIFRNQNGFKLKSHNNTKEKQDAIISEIVQTIISGTAEEKNLCTDTGTRLAVELSSTSRFDESLAIPNGGIDCTFTLEDGKTKIKVPVSDGKEYKNYVMLNRLSFLYEALKHTGREEDALTAQTLEPRIQKLLEEYNSYLPDLNKRYLASLVAKLNSTRNARGSNDEINRLTAEIEKVRARIKQSEEKEAGTDSETLDLTQYLNTNNQLIAYMPLQNNNAEMSNVVMEDKGPLNTIAARDIVEAYWKETEKLNGLGITHLNKFNRYFFIKKEKGITTGRIETAVEPEKETER